jgi:CHAT domain
MHHHLELSEPSVLDMETLTAREIFGSKFSIGAHVTTFSCKSGLSVASPANDAVGLNAALFYAGASSTVSSL